MRLVYLYLLQLVVLQVNMLPVNVKREKRTIITLGSLLKGFAFKKNLFNKLSVVKSPTIIDQKQQNIVKESFSTFLTSGPTKFLIPFSPLLINSTKSNKISSNLMPENSTEFILNSTLKSLIKTSYEANESMENNLITKNPKNNLSDISSNQNNIYEKDIKNNTNNNNNENNIQDNNSLNFETQQPPIELQKTKLKINREETSINYLDPIDTLNNKTIDSIDQSNDYLLENITSSDIRYRPKSQSYVKMHDGTEYINSHDQYTPFVYPHLISYQPFYADPSFQEFILH